MRALTLVSGLVMVAIVGAALGVANHRAAVVEEAGHEHGWMEHHPDVPEGGVMGPDMHAPEAMEMPAEPPEATEEDEEQGASGGHHHHDDDHEHAH